MGVKDIKKFGDKDTHTWRWWVWRRVVTRLLVQPANTGQENEVEKGRRRRSKILTRRNI